MPSVVGETADEARVALEKQGLAVATEYWWSPEVPAGFVMYQHPSSNEALNRGEPAVIVISRGPLRLTVPNLVGRPSDEATRILRQAGLVNPPSVRYQGPRELSPAILGSTCNGCVVSMSPLPGAEVPPEGIISLAIRKD
jgi:serine/threonine-protein kinase